MTLHYSAKAARVLNLPEFIAELRAHGRSDDAGRLEAGLPTPEAIAAAGPGWVIGAYALDAQGDPRPLVGTIVGRKDSRLVIEAVSAVAGIPAGAHVDILPAAVADLRRPPGETAH